MKSNFKMSLLMGLFVVVSCGKSDESKTQESANPVRPPVENSKTEVSTEKASFNVLAIRKTEFKPDFSNLSEFKKNINNYSLRFEAQSGTYKNTKVECEKAFTRNQEKSAAFFDQKGLTASVDVSIYPVDKNSVRFNCSVYQNDTEIDYATLTLSKSVVISDEVIFSSNIGDGHLDTIVIDEKGSLIINGGITFINASTLISDKGKISTFPENKITSGDNLPGQSGSTIYINLKKAFGDITFKLRGTNGGVQKIKPDPQTLVHNPARARNGQCKNGEEPGNEALCKGEDGLKGYPGLKGFKGQNGGDTGSLDLRIAENTNLQYSIEYMVGQGSMGGEGGEGGVGQLGGLGNTIHWMEHVYDCGITCNQKNRGGKRSKTFPNGKDGAQGDIGEKGQDGIAGNKKTSIVFINNEENIYITDGSNK